MRDGRRPHRGRPGPRLGRRELAGGADRRGGAPCRARRACRGRARPSCPTASSGASRSRAPTTPPRCRGGVGVVASAVLEGGALTGRYAQAGASGRLQALRDDPRLAEALRAGEGLSALARELDTTPAALAIAFALTNPRVASVVFGASTPEQVAENVAAWELLGRLDETALQRI